MAPKIDGPRTSRTEVRTEGGIRGRSLPQTASRGAIANCPPSADPRCRTCRICPSPLAKAGERALCFRSVASLKSKLSRLDATGLASPARTPPTTQPPPASQETEPPAAGAGVIESLRQKIARILARDPSPPPVPWKPSDGELPFLEQHTPSGPLYSRVLRYEAHHRVGRFPVGPAQRADMTLLSLLALDPSIAACAPARALYIDTETTGLSGGTGTLVFLLGLGYFHETDGCFRVEQLLLRAPPVRKRRFSTGSWSLAETSSLWVTFNGKSFDLPLLRTRLVMNRAHALPDRPHLDLLHVARRVHRTRMQGCSLGAVENRVLGFARVDDVPSGEVSARYSHFLRTGDEGALTGVISHNAWDIVALAALVSLYGEMLDGLAGEDLAGVAATLHRARAWDRAAQVANEAVLRGGGPHALRARAQVAKARGERDSALVDFEALLAEVDDSSVRLELAKLYEHHLKAPGRALEMVELGVAEAAERSSRRATRLRKKLAKGATSQSAQPSLPGISHSRRQRSP